MLWIVAIVFLTRASRAEHATDEVTKKKASDQEDEQQSQEEGFSVL